MKLLLVIVLLFTLAWLEPSNVDLQSFKVAKPDGDFACKITAADKLVVRLECTDTTRLIVPRAGWPPAWGELHTVWSEKHLVGQVHYAERRDGRLTAVKHASHVTSLRDRRVPERRAVAREQVQLRRGEQGD